MGEYWSLVRGYEVGRLEGVQCSVKLEELDKRIKGSNVDKSLQERILEVVCRDFKDKSKEEDTLTEFEDLGTSVRMKKVEEALAEKSYVHGEKVEADNVIKNFEQKWFTI